MPRPLPPYPPEFRAEAVRLARGSGNRSSRWRPTWASRLRRCRAGCGGMTPTRAGQPDELAADEREELRRLRREDHVLKQEREVLKKMAAFFAKETS